VLISRRTRFALLDLEPIRRGLAMAVFGPSEKSGMQQQLRSGGGSSFLEAAVLRTQRWPPADFALRCSAPFLSAPFFFSRAGICHGLAMTLPRRIRKRFNKHDSSRRRSYRVLAAVRFDPAFTGVW